MALATIYSSAAVSINSALTTAGITTLLVAHAQNQTINAVVHNNLIDYIGYVLNSDLMKVNNIIETELARYGKFATLKSPARPVTVPSNPVDDHYVTLNGYYIENSDIDTDKVLFDDFKGKIESDVRYCSSVVQSRAKTIQWNTSDETSTITITDVSPTAKTISVAITIDLTKS